MQAGRELRRRQAIVIAPRTHVKNKFQHSTRSRPQRPRHSGCNNLQRTPANSPKMKPPTRIAIRTLPRLANSPSILAGTPSISCRAASIHTSTATTAKVVPIYGTGPPPEPPAPSEAYPDARIARRKKQAEMLRQAQNLRSAKGLAAAARSGKSNPLKKRFWQSVHVREVDGELHHIVCP